MRYLSQRFTMPMPELKGTLTDIGTEITALEVKAVYSPQRVEVWFRCPSGWLCARMGEEVYVK